MTAEEILDILENHYSKPVGRRPSPWAFLREVRLGTGKYRRAKWKNQPKSIRQRIDAWVYNTWPSCREAIAFEIKTSRADYLREIRNPEKRRAAMEVSNRYFLVTPFWKINIHPDEIPEDCGWITVDGDQMHIIKEAPYRELGDLPGHFVNSLIRRIAKSEKTNVEAY